MPRCKICDQPKSTSNRFSSDLSRKDCRELTVWTKALEILSPACPTKIRPEHLGEPRQYYANIFLLTNFWQEVRHYFMVNILKMVSAYACTLQFLTLSPQYSQSEKVDKLGCKMNKVWFTYSAQCRKLTLMNQLVPDTPMITGWGGGETGRKGGREGESHYQ